MNAAVYNVYNIYVFEFEINRLWNWSYWFDFRESMMFFFLGKNLMLIFTKKNYLKGINVYPVSFELLAPRLTNIFQVFYLICNWPLTSFDRNALIIKKKIKLKTFNKKKTWSFILTGSHCKRHWFSNGRLGGAILTTTSDVRLCSSRRSHSPCGKIWTCSFVFITQRSGVYSIFGR